MMKNNLSALKQFFLISISGIFLSCFLISEAPAQIKRVWAVDDGEKIKQDDITNPLATDKNNAVWKKKSINIFGGKNEIIAFQLIIEADATGAKDINVTVSDLKNGASEIPGSETGPDDPFDYRGRYVELFTEHYINIPKQSPPGWFYQASAAPSNYYLGWVPDCLIPFSAPKGKGGAPFSVEANKNQAVWVDILIPKNAVPGIYKGQITITVADISKTIPINLKVYNFTLPDSTHIYSMFGFSSVSGRHGLKAGTPEFDKTDTRYMQMAHRHRMNLMKRPRSLEELEATKSYLTGEMYSQANGYAGPGENIGNNAFCVGYNGAFPLEYGGSFKNATQESWWAGSDAWKNWFVKNAPHVQLNKYLFPDEPGSKGAPGKKGTGSMDTIRIQTKWARSNPGPGRKIPSLVTASIRQDLMGHVDFWSMSGSGALKALPEDVASVRAHGDMIGVYNGYRPALGAVITDADATDFRVIPWIVWKYDLDQYFYWSTNFWGRLDVFSNPYTYQNRYAGDGTFFYPGTDAQVPGQSRELDGPLSSVRMKNYRRGSQDVEYMWLAKQAGKEAEMKAILSACVPVALWEAKNLKDAAWPARGYSFEKYREQLAKLISENR